ncbi:MAG: hypothetical protein LBQ48_04810 [Oscillospiraceae bacterium]|nr:hypothetical protein [Oscillospiraceae bacterium]
MRPVRIPLTVEHAWGIDSKRVTEYNECETETGKPIVASHLAAAIIAESK